MKRAVFLVFSGLLLSAVCAVAAPAAPKAPSDDDKEGTIAGTAVPREKGGFIGVELKDGTFRVTFYNEKKKPVPADKASAVLRWPVHYQPNNERTELLPTDDPAVLASDYPVKPPHTFKLHISLLSPSTADVESYVIDFSG
jgi:hypothetical protein